MLCNIQWFNKQVYFEVHFNLDKDHNNWVPMENLHYTDDEYNTLKNCARRGISQGNKEINESWHVELPVNPSIKNLDDQLCYSLANYR